MTRQHCPERRSPARLAQERRIRIAEVLVMAVALLAIGGAVVQAVAH